MRQAQDQLTPSDVCAACRKSFADDVAKAREQAWRNLPIVVGLPSWEELEREAEELLS